jgi:hypothetical protein
VCHDQAGGSVHPRTLSLSFSFAHVQEEGSDHLAYEQITLLVWARAAFHVYADSITGSDLELDPLGSVSLGQLGTLGPQLVRRAATID